LPAKIQILIVDDHAVLREGLKFVLSKAPDMEVAAEAARVDDALELLKHGRFDVILLDLSLPGESGLDLLEAVKATQSAPPVLILSAFTEDQYAVQALKAGADGYLNKESAPELLVAAVRRVASGSRRQTCQ
jgi:two-component system invasion response regulator UvrY